MLVQIILLILSSLIASGVLFGHRGLLTYLACAGVLWEAQWLFLTLLSRTVFRNINVELVLWVGSAVIVIAWVGWLKRFSFPRWSRDDAAIAGVTAIVLAAACLIFQFNSFGSSEWVLHGFFNGDTATLIAITEKAKATNGLVQQNPFAGNGPLEYPSLLHAGLANLTIVPQRLPWITYLQVLLTVPIFFLLLPGRKSWLSAGLVLYVIALSWESYVYPQGHFFLMGMFMLMAALLTKSWDGSVRQTYPQLGLAVMLGVVLLFSNAVTGTAAVLLKVIYDGLNMIKRGQLPLARLGWTIGVVFWIVLFFLFTPGNGSLGWIPGFSYTAASELGRLAPVLILVSVGMWLTYERKLFTSMAALGMMALALVTFVFSTRDIVIENASRFFYHTVLVAFPLVLPPLIRGYYWFKREFIYSSRSGIEKVVGWGTAVVLLTVFLLPAGASVASTHDNLMFKDEQRITREMFEQAELIKQTTELEAVIPGSPDPPFWIPMLTGRALPSTNFWLSPGQEPAN